MKDVTVETVFDSVQSAFDLLQPGECVGFVKPDTRTGISECDVELMHYQHQLSRTCSLICRQAVQYARIQERWCSEEMAEWTTARIQKKEERIEDRIIELVSELPEVDGKPIKVLFGGDPRGHTVKLIMPDGRYDSWGGVEHGIGVPGS